MEKRPSCPPGCQCGRHTHVVRTRHEKQCEECGATFTAKRADARFCTPDCRVTAYQRENRDKIRATQRSWQARNRETSKRYHAEHRETIRAAKRDKYAAEMSDPETAEAKREASRQYYRENRERILARVKAKGEERGNARRRSLHGTDWEELFGALWEAQQGLCYLCGDPLRQDVPKAIHLDHDHSCCPLGKSCERCRRGLACKNCNLIIGLAVDSPDRLRSIAAALELANAGVAERMLQPRLEREPFTRDATCKACGKTFAAGRSDREYCSDSCYYRHRYRARQAAKGRQVVPRKDPLLVDVSHPTLFP